MYCRSGFAYMFYQSGVSQTMHDTVGQMGHNIHNVLPVWIDTMTVLSEWTTH